MCFLFFHSVDFSAAVAKVMVGVIDHTVLPRRHTMYLLVCLKMPDSFFLTYSARIELRGVTYLERNAVRCVGCIVFPRIGSDEMQMVHLDVLFIDLLWIVAMRDEEDVALHILFHHKPRSTTKAKSFALAYGIEPQSAVLADEMTCFQLTHIARVLTQMSFDVVSEVDVAKKADTLTVLALCIEQACTLGNIPDFMFPQMTDGEHQFLDLQVVYLRKEVGLVFHRVGAGR